MGTNTVNELSASGYHTEVDRKSDLELVITRMFNAPAQTVFAAWTTPAFLKQWWAPKSMGATLVACDVDARSGGKYSFGFGHPSSESPIVFHGKYLEVIPPSRIVWTNEESEEGAVTTVSIQEKGAQTLLTLQEVYPNKEALDIAIEGMENCMPEQFEQLDALLVTLNSSEP